MTDGGARKVLYICGAAFALLLVTGSGGCSRENGASSDGGAAGSSAAPDAAALNATKAVDAASLVPFGKPFDLKVGDLAITYCDDNGAWRYDTVTDTSIHVDRTCPPEEDADTACGCGGAKVKVRNPGLGPSDVVDTDDGSYPLPGRVHDCACLGQTIYVATDMGDIFALAHVQKPRLIAHAKAQRIAVSPKWIAWTDGKKVSVIKAK